MNPVYRNEIQENSEKAYVIVLPGWKWKRMKSLINISILSEKAVTFAKRLKDLKNKKIKTL